MNKLLTTAVIASGLLVCLAMTDQQANRIADAIYRVEGGAKAKVPYGILSVKVRDETDARRICLNTVRNNYRRWLNQTKENNYFFFLADKYCPSSVDRQGNKRWRNNIVKILGNEFVTQINKRFMGAKARDTPTR